MFNFVQPSALPMPGHMAPQNPDPASTDLRLQDPPFWMFPILGPPGTCPSCQRLSLRPTHVAAAFLLRLKHLVVRGDLLLLLPLQMVSGRLPPLATLNGAAIKTHVHVSA